MDSIFDDFTKAQAEYSGPLLATTLSPISPPSNISRLRDFFQSSNAAQIQTDLRYKIVYNNKSAVRIGGEEGNAWVAVYAAYWQAVGHLLATEDALARGNDHEVKWIKVYDSWKDVTTSLIRGYTSAGFAAWTIPCLYTTARNLRSFAIKADQQSSAGKNEMSFGSALQDDIVAEVDKNQKLKDAVQLLNRIFQLCANDKAPLEDSKKWGIYYTTNLLLKTYFKLNSISLSKNLLRALHATSADLPPMESFPKSHIVTFKYYVGIISFLEEDYIKAEEHLTFAYRQCHKSARKNRELILTYLIPCHLLTTHTLPSSTLLAPFPRLRVLFAPLSQCIRRGDLAGFDAALAAGEDEFVRRRIYLTLERGRDIALRNLLRKVFVFGGYEPLKEGQTVPVRRTRVPLQEFSVAIGLGQSSKTSRLELMEDDEVECLLAGMIYKNLMKGYISREHKMVVLSKAGAFPGTGV